MKRRIIWIAAGTLLLLAVAAVFGINVYIQSAGMQTKIISALENSLGVPVKIIRTSFTPWGGLTFRGITLDLDRDPATKIHHVEAGALTAKVDFLPLFSRKLIIHQLLLENPSLTLTQSGVYPFLTRPRRNSADTTHSPESEKNVSKSTQCEVVLKNSVMRQGSLLFLDVKGHPLVSVEGIEVNAKIGDANAVTGTLRIARIAVHNKLHLEKLESPFHYEDSTFTLSPLTATLAGGSVRGSFAGKTNADHAPYTANLELDHIDLQQVLEQLGGPPNRATGHFLGTFTVEGDFRDPDVLKGNGHLELTEGTIRQYELFQTLGKALDVDELSQLQFQQAHVDFTLQGRETVVNEILFGSDNLRLTASGRIGKGGTLELPARLYMNRKITRRLPDLVKNNMQDAEGLDGYRFLEFYIGGTLEEPQSNLIEQLVGKGLEGKVNDLLRGLIGGPKKPKPTPKPKKIKTPPVVIEEPSATPSPSPQP